MKNKPQRVLFIHHSVGRQIIKEGNLRELLGSSCCLIDHDRNRIGLSDCSGQCLKRAFPIPDDCTDPPGLVKLFEKFQSDLSHEIDGVDLIVVKSCYPNAKIKSSVHAQEVLSIYDELFELASQLKPKTLLVSSPPMSPMSIRAEYAERYRDLVIPKLRQKWQADFCGFVDIFSELSDGRGCLDRKYRRIWPWESHLNRLGAQTAARTIAESIKKILHASN
ncbi:hypothetical protein CR973_00350 [Candidatus Saccharibacteria bacterium]|nr:MAG: hypothetical protein CR973_00350 [Candidatus Saccharibacteria bacterium]